jgi:hypothetical protein
MPEPEKTAVVFPDWVMLDCSGRTKYYDVGDPDDEDLKKVVAGPNAVGVDTTVVRVDTSSSCSGYFSFTLAAPPRVSYLDLYWPRCQTDSGGFIIDTAFSSVLAADKNLVLLSIVIVGTRSSPRKPGREPTRSGSSRARRKLEPDLASPSQLVEADEST